MSQYDVLHVQEGPLTALQEYELAFEEHRRLGEGLGRSGMNCVNLVQCRRVRGRWQPDRLAQALAGLVIRHPALRSVPLQAPGLTTEERSASLQQCVLTGILK